MCKLSVAVMVLAGWAGAAVACPDFNLQANEAYAGEGGQLHNGQVFNVVAGGENDIRACRHIRPGTDQGAGYFTSQPDFSFSLSKMGQRRLIVSVVSECDAALLINTATAGWYYDDDDNGNLDPRIVLTRPADGRIDIWVGTFDGAYCTARLRVQAPPR